MIGLSSWRWLLLVFPVGLVAKSTVLRSEDLTERATVMSYQSEALAQEQPFLVIRPLGEAPEEGWPVLFVLHGHGRHHLTLWENEVTRALLLERSYLIVMPYTGKGWYIDSPVDPTLRYEAALDELIKIVAHDFPVASGREAWGIAGWSMGGYGAVRNGARRNDRFSLVCSMIGLLDFPRIEGLPEGQRYRISTTIFGEDRAIWATLNPIRLVGALAQSEVLVIIAEQAFDRTMNENFLAAAAHENVPIEVVRLVGGHTFPVVAAALPHVLTAAHQHFSNLTNTP